MPYIKVDIKKLSQYLQTMENVRAITGSATGDFCAIANSIDPQLRQMNGLDGQLRSIEEALYHHQRVQSNMSGFLDFAQQKYRLLSNHDSVGDADLNTGAVYAVSNVIVNLQSQVCAADTPAPEASGDVQTRFSEAEKKEIEEKYQSKVTSEAAVAVGVVSGTTSEQPDAVVAKTAAVATGVTVSAMDEQAELLRSAADRLNVKVEDLLKGMEEDVYTLKDIAEFIDGKATDANKFIQNAAAFLKVQTGTQDIVFEKRNGHWILSEYLRDSKANNLVMKYHNSTGIGSRYNEDTLKNTPVLGSVFKADQIAKKAENVVQKVHKTADYIDKSTDAVLFALDTADKVREHSYDAADKIASILADKNATRIKKIAASKAVADTTIVSTTLDVAAAPAGLAVNSVVSKYVGEKAGDTTLGKEVGNAAEKLVKGSVELVSSVVASEAVVDQITQSNLEIGNAIAAGDKAISEAGRKLLESDSVGETIRNVGNFVVVAGSSKSNVITTAVREGAEVVYTVAKEATLNAAEQVGDAVVAGCETAYSKIKTEYETIKDFKEEVVGGLSTAFVLANEAQSIMKSSDKDIAFNEAVALAAKEMGISEADIHDSINKGLCTTQDIFEYLEGKATESNAFVKKFASTLRTVSGATDMLFKNKDGYIIVSEFTRKGWTNALVKTFHDGTGIGTRYKPETLKDTPVIGTLYKADEAVKVMDKVVKAADAVVTGVTGVVETGKKINAIWEDETLTKKEKIYDTAAVSITGVVGTALDVGAPFAGAAVKTAVTGALTAAIPVVGPVVGNAIGAVAGAIVEGGMQLVSDVITSEAVVNQLSDSMMKVGDTVAAEGKVVSEAGKKILESKNAKEALTNTAEFVGTALKSGTKVLATAVTENAKVAVTVVQETAKAVGDAVVSKFKAVGETAKKVADGAKKAAEAVGDAVCAGAKVVSNAAKEAAEKAAKALEEAKAEAKRKAEQLAREAEERARKAAQKAAEEIKRKAEEAKRIAEEAKRKAEEAARRAAEEARRKAEEIARKAAEAKRKAEEAARKAAEAARRKAEEIARQVAEAKRRAQEAARRAAEEARRRAEEAKRRAQEAARRAAEEVRRRAEEAKRRAQEAARKAAEAARKTAQKVKNALSKW